jgi:hypothetical protein
MLSGVQLRLRFRCRRLRGKVVTSEIADFLDRPARFGKIRLHVEYMPQTGKDPQRYVDSG